jgi:predicted transcriptional regulator of viral defense system
VKHIDKVIEFANRTPVFDTKSVVRIVGNDGYAYVLLNYLLKTGKAKRLTRGCYTVYDDPSLLVYCLKPAYIGLQDAMSFHNLWEQETNPVILTTRRVRVGIREVLGSNVIVRRITPKHFFGFEYYKYGEFLLPVSDLEKTFIDMVYFNEMRKDMIGVFRKKVNERKLKKYLKRYDRRFADRVMAFFSEEIL